MTSRDVINLEAWNEPWNKRLEHCFVVCDHVFEKLRKGWAMRHSIFCWQALCPGISPFVHVEEPLQMWIIHVLSLWGNDFLLPGQNHKARTMQYCRKLEEATGSVETNRIKYLVGSHKAAPEQERGPQCPPTKRYTTKNRVKIPLKIMKNHNFTLYPRCEECVRDV